MNHDIEQLLNFLVPSGTPIETLTQTAWGGHIPFMFCLMNFMRPRNYVELGTHYGASFFAVCQAIRQFEIACVPTAIDLWSGDEHAGSYEEDVFKQFTWIHENKYKGIGVALRKDFNLAADDFSSHSIDLIHIDGLHTYDAVRQDYETWLPKASKNSVILFHDTAVRKKDFGVWKLWEEIEGNYASFNFTNSNGLGVIAIGSATENPVVSLMNIINQSEATKKSFNNFFSLAGERAVAEAMAKIQLLERQDPYRYAKLIRKLLRRSGRKISKLMLPKQET